MPTKCLIACWQTALMHLSTSHYRFCLPKVIFLMMDLQGDNIDAFLELVECDRASQKLPDQARTVWDKAKCSDGHGVWGT